MEPRRSLPCFVDGLWTDAQSEARPPCLLECIISTVGKHHGQSSIPHPFLIMAIFPNECSSPADHSRPAPSQAAQRHLLVSRRLGQSHARSTLTRS